MRVCITWGWIDGSIQSDIFMNDGFWGTLLLLHFLRHCYFGARPRVVFLQDARADGKSAGADFSNKYLAVFTAASAWPLDLGLYGDEVSCVMPFFLQYMSKGPRNWGLPSILYTSGMPNILVIESRMSVTAVVVVLPSMSIKMYPLYLSAVTMYVFPLMWKRSTDICSIGKVAVVAMKGSTGLLGRNRWHCSQQSVIDLISYFIDGQKYNDLAVFRVLP